MSKADVPKKERKYREGKDIDKPIVAKTAHDLQRLKLMKLMKNPEKPVLLPERPKSKNSPSVPEFVRNVMGSSAGAGSGEFHVYRHLRRKEYSRQKFIQEKGRKETLDDEYHQKLEQNKIQAEQTTAKKRAKRLKKKQKQKEVKKQKSAKNGEDEGEKNQSDVSRSDSDSSDDENAEKLEKTETADTKENNGTTTPTESAEKIATAESVEKVDPAVSKEKLGNEVEKVPDVVIDESRDSETAERRRSSEGADNEKDTKS